MPVHRANIRTPYSLLTGGGAGRPALETQQTWVLPLGTSAHDLRLSGSRQPTGAKRSHPAPQAQLLAQNLSPPQTPPFRLRKIVSVVLERGLPWARECDWAASAGLCPSACAVALSGPAGHRGCPLSTQMLPQPQPGLRPLLGAPVPEAQAAPGSVTKRARVSLQSAGKSRQGRCLRPHVRPKLKKLVFSGE